jgi:hypothetical protein
VYEDTAFSGALWDVNLHKRLLNSTDTGLINSWLAFANYGKRYSMTPYYAEAVYHVGLLNPKPFLGYIIRSEVENKGDNHPHVDAGDYYCMLQEVDELMAELTRVAGYSDRKPIELPMNWNSQYVLSGMYVNGKNLWRITPNTELVSTKDFKIEGADPTFRVAGQTVKFPGGKIIEDGKISVTGTCGYWVETAKDVTPIVTTDADRFEKIPAYIEDFESYKSGTQLTTMVMREDGGWIVQQPKDSPITVETDGENQLISMTGDGLLRNKLIPANVTAADSYAMEQIWELTVVVPGELGGQFVFLDYAMDNEEVTDGGYKIEGGKVYYSENGQYKELLHLVRHLKTKSVRIICDKPTGINLDGEKREAEVIDMRIADEKLRFFYPKGLTF